MAFKLSYSFEGDHRSRPEQNLSGASHKLTREVLLQKTHEERRKREEQRVRLQSAILLQSYIRSYLTRKHVKEERRMLYDTREDSTPLNILLSELLFFYDRDLDKVRLYRMSEKILHQSEEVLSYAGENRAFSWLLKRFLAVCIEALKERELIEISLICLDVFGNDAQTLFYLIKKGYFEHLRNFLDSIQSECIEKVLHLINRPFKYCLLETMEPLVISKFCNSFLIPNMSNSIKHILIPHLKSKKEFPFEKIIRYLNSGYCFENTNSIFYCMLSLEPDDYEPSVDGFQVLSTLSRNLYLLKTPTDLIMYDSDEENDEEHNSLLPEQHLILSDYLHILNKPDKVKRWLHFLEMNSDNEEVLISFIKLCHNLLLVYRDSMRKYLLLYKLGLSGSFLNKLWNLLNRKISAESPRKTSFLMSWKEIHTILSVFCDMFTFYTETLTDRENSDTSETFTQYDLYSMSQVLKCLAVELIEMAFPMCRSSSVAATQEMLHLYNSCLNCVKMLYMLDIRKQFCPSGFWTAKKIHISQDLHRKNYLSKTIRPFYGIISENDDDEHLPPLSTIEQRSLAILQQLPFLISFNTRVLLLRELCHFSLGDNEYQRIQRDFLSENVVIRRTHLYEDAFKELSSGKDIDLRHKVRIQFINSVGLEEAGIDGGGIFKEFINEVLKTAFDPNRGFFLLTADNTLYPNPNVHLIVENFTDHYYFIGRLVGKAMFENILVDLPLAEFFLAKLLVDRASAHYLKSLDPILYRNLLYLRDYPGDVSDLGLDFTTINNDLGETRVMELKPHGRNIPVTNENRLEYIQRLADLKLNVQLQKQCTAFREGLDSVVPLLWLRLFSHRELQVIIGGDTQEIDLSDLRAHTTYGGEFTADHVTILSFWRVVHTFTDLQKKQLLKFVTSCSRPPLLGFKELNPPFCIQSSGNEDRMPTASTCLNLLKIPIIKDEDTLKKKLLSAIEQQAGFELS